jgi:hypothetical protein
MTDKYPDDCKHRDNENHIVCKIFDMSCAMFHTRIFSLPSCAGKGKCPYYEAAP